jgi:hypothetical protein
VTAALALLEEHGFSKERSASISFNNRKAGGGLSWAYSLLEPKVENEISGNYCVGLVTNKDPFLLY